VNFRLQPDLASSAKPPMSIRHPPSIAPPDHQRLTFWLSPSVSSSGSASFSTLQLSLVRLLLAWLFDQCAGLRLRLNLCSLTGCLPPACADCTPPADFLCVDIQLRSAIGPSILLFAFRLASTRVGCSPPAFPRINFRLPTFIGYLSLVGPSILLLTFVRFSTFGGSCD
jgi:hypothetical protein